MARKNEPYIYKVLRRETPNPRQQAFFRAEAANIAYGGARGGGKSWAMRRKLVLLAMRYPGLKLLLLRRTLPELRANHILPLQRELAGYAAWSGAERAFRFPNGSRLVMGYCDSDSDCAQYQGQEYEVIGFEEATNFEPDWLTFIATCLRTTRTDFAPRIYYTCNPGGPGHAYIKRLFIDRAFHDGEDPADYVFIPAKVYDNQVLMQRDPGYLKRLEALPPARRRAHLEGDWNVYEGQVFAEWRDDPAHYADGKWTHVIEPFDIPNTWRVYRSDSDSDCAQYQGQEYEVIGFEEATNFEPDWLTFIATCLRTTRTDFAPRIYYTCNPGGPGHAYIKRLFIDRAFHDGEDPADYVFIPAKVYDNQVLMQRDPGYLKRLEALPPARRRAHLEGDWNVYEGQVFAEWRDDPAHYADGKWTHVIEPFDIPNTWRVYRSFDFGYAKPFSVGWWAVDFDGRLYRILELYGCVPGEPDTGVRWTPEQIFEQIRTTEATHPYLRGRDIRGVADPAIWDASRGDSIADIADRYGVYFEPGDHKRLPGWMQVHYRLAFDAAGLPMLYVFLNCRDTRRTLPLLRYDAHAPEDVDTRQEDHIADEIRYLCQSDPIAPRPVVQRTPKVFDPLSSD